MSPKWKTLTACIFMLEVVASPRHSQAAKHPECVMPPNKPVQCVRGSVTDKSGALTPFAKVSILQGEKEVATMTTGADARFAFPKLEPGDYILHVEAEGLRTLHTSITVVKSSSKCKQALQVVLGVGFECDTYFAPIKAKDLR